MNVKKIISEREACEIFYKVLHNRSVTAVEGLQKMCPDFFKNIDIKRAKTLLFYASIYCSMLPIKDSFYLKQAKRIQEMVISSIARIDDFYDILKELSKAHSVWDELLYKPSPEHPFENIARYLYLKWGLPKQKIKLGETILDRPNLFVVWTIEACLVTAITLWEAIAKSYEIVDEDSRN